MENTQITPEFVAWLIGFLPDHWKPYATAIILALGTFSVIVVQLRAAVMTLQGVANFSKRIDFKRVGAVFDVLAFVTSFAKGVGEVLAAHKAPSIPPAVAKMISKRPPPIPPGGAMLIALALSLTSSTACAAREVRTQAQIATASYDVLTATGKAIQDEAQGDWDELHARGLQGAELEQAEAALQAHYEPIRAAFEAARALQNAYVDAVKARASGGPPVGTELALGLIRRWAELVKAAEALGVEVPNPPDILRALAGGVP